MCSGLFRTIRQIHKTGPGIVSTDPITKANLRMAGKTIRLIKSPKGSGKILQLTGQRMLQAG
jgi:hypothetical protein